MAIDPSIPLQVRPFQAPDRLNMMAQVLGVQNAQTQNAMGQYGLAKAQRQDQQTNALMAAIQSGQIDPTTSEGVAKASAIAPESPVIANLLKARETQSTIGKNDAESGKFRADTAAKVTEQYRNQLANVSTPQQAAQWLKAQYDDPVIGKLVGTVPYDTAVAQIPSDPQNFQQWLQRNAVGMSKFIELNKPTTTVVNAGGTEQVLQTPGLGGAPQTVASIEKTVSPDAQLSSQTQITTTGMNNATSRATNAATNATSRANNAATIQKDLTVAGLNGTGDGSVNQNVEQMAQAIAAGKAAPITGFALAKPQGQTVMRRVFEINPNYDETTYAAKLKAARDFTSGQQGNALRSVATANQHLDQLGELVTALNNGNVQVANRIGNFLATQTGNPNATNFEAIKNIVGQEVVKAIVAGGGSAGERDEAAKAFSTAASPAQLKGAIEHYRMVMGAQQQNLLAQRRAAGLTDETLPAYSGSAPAPAGGGWQYLGVQK